MTARLPRRHALCGWCLGPISPDRRASARWCSDSHSVPCLQSEETGGCARRKPERDRWGRGNRGSLTFNTEKRLLYIRACTRVYAVIWSFEVSGILSLQRLSGAGAPPTGGPCETRGGAASLAARRRAILPTRHTRTLPAVVSQAQRTRLGRAAHLGTDREAITSNHRVCHEPSRSRPEREPTRVSAHSARQVSPIIRSRRNGLQS